MSYAAFREPVADRSRPGHRRRLTWDKRAVIAGVAVVAIVVAAAAVYLAGTDPAQSMAANVSTSAAQTQSRNAVPPASAAPSGAAPSGAATPSSAAATPKVPASGWIPVDQAAWKAQVAAYNAVKIDPVPAGVGNLAEFRADCTYSHSLPDDPIVLPALPGASHMHSFIGNEAVNADTMAEDLTTSTAHHLQADRGPLVVLGADALRQRDRQAGRALGFPGLLPLARDDLGRPDADAATVCA